MYKVYRYLIHGRNRCEWVNVGWKLVRVGGSGLKLRLKMSGSGWMWMGVNESRWE